MAADDDGIGGTVVELLRSKASYAALGIIISIIALFIVFWNADFHAIHEAVSRANWPLLTISLLLTFVWLIIKTVRWHVLIQTANKPGFLAAFSAYSLGNLGNMILPLRGGEVVRLIAFSSSSGLPKSMIIASMVTERSWDLLSLLCLFFIAIVLAPLGEIISYKILIAAAMSALLLGMIVFRSHLEKISIYLIDRAKSRLPDRIERILRSAVGGFFHGLKLRGGMAQLYLLILLAIVILAVQAIQVWLAMLAFNIDLETSLGIEVVICVILFTTIGAAVPSSPGYIGTFHLSVTMALSLFKVPEASALSFAIVLHIISVVCIISTGLIGMFYFKSTEEVYKAFSKNDVG